MIFVSAQHGNDTNAGTYADPVREIARAVELSPVGGVVVVLDSGDFRDFNVANGVTVTADRVHARIHPGDGPTAGAVTVNAGSTASVVLKGLNIAGRPGTVGIRFSGGQALHVEGCTISGIGAHPEGHPGAAIMSTNGTLHVTETLLHDNLTGLEARGSRVVLERCAIRGDKSPNSINLNIGGGAHVTATRCLISNGDNGIYIRGLAGSPRPLLSLITSMVTHNRIGIYADRTGQVHLSKSSVTLNDTGLFTLNDGVIYTSGDNSVVGNVVRNIGGAANVSFFKSDVTA